jgi:putative glutamine amidotransferase
MRGTWREACPPGRWRSARTDRGGEEVVILPHRPLRVALTTSVEDRTEPFARPSVFLYTSYIHALEQIGMAPVLITPAHSPGAIAALMDACNGIVLSGGEDIDPARYGEDPSPALGTVTPARDGMEFRALHCAIERQLPVLGICRGHQLLNVYYGGSLFQDIGTEVPGDLVHEQSQPWDQRSHRATVDCDSMLCRIVGTERLFINSFHHQAIKRLGAGLRIVARAEDGLVEAVEHESYPWMLGVQWHPERNEATASDTDPDRRIFIAFRDAVLAHAGTRAVVGD